MKSYLENVEVLKVVILGDYEKDVILRIRNRDAKTRIEEITKGIIECFDPNRAFFETGKVYLVKLGLVDFDMQKTTEKKKDAIFIKKTPLAVNEYTIKGEVVERSGKEIVVDCGFYLYANDETHRFKAGDWIKMRGRLDAFLP